MTRFTLSPSYFRKKSSTTQEQRQQPQMQSSQRQYSNAPDIMENWQQPTNKPILTEARAKTAEISIPAFNNSSSNATNQELHLQHHQQQQQQQQQQTPLPALFSSSKFASAMRLGRRRHEPSSQQLQPVNASLADVLPLSDSNNNTGKRNKSHIFKGKEKEEQEQELQEQNNEIVKQQQEHFYRAPLPDQWVTNGGSRAQGGNSNSNNSNNKNNSIDSMAAVVELLLQHNRNDTQQKHQKKESKREVATTTATSMLTMRDKDGIVEVMSSPHEGCPQHQVQELGPLSPTVQQQPQEKERQEKEWRQHEQLKDQEKPISLAPLDGSAFVSEGVWTKIKKRSGLYSTLPSFLFKNGDHGLRQRRQQEPTTGAPSQITPPSDDNGGGFVSSLTHAAKATTTAARGRGAMRGLFFFDRPEEATGEAATNKRTRKRRNSHGSLMIVDSPLSSPITTTSTIHSSPFASATAPPRPRRSLASFSFLSPFHPNDTNSNSFLSLPYINSNDDTEDVEAQRSRLNAIRNSWCEQFQAPGDPVLVVATSSFPSSPSPPSSPSNKQVRRTHTAHNVTNTNGNTGTNSYGNNNTVHNNISKSPSQNTNATATTIFTGTTPTSSYRRGSLGYSSVHQQQFNNNHNNNINGGGSAVLDQETISTWRGLLASVRQLSHDTSTTGSSTHYSSASSTSLSSSAQSINNINSCNEREQVWKSKGHNARHSKYRNSDDASTIRATESFFNRRLSSSSQQQLKGIATHAFSGLAATSSSSTIDLEKRVMMTARNPPKKLTILVLGDGAVGKSALTLRFLRDQFTDEYDPTIEDSYCKYIEVDGQDYTLELTDTAGQSEYRDQWDDQFMRTGDGFICVYSIASMSSFGELVGFRDQIWRAKGSRRVPIVITGNKCDLQEGEREVRMDVGALFAERSNALFVETSAKTGVNIHEMFTELVREIERAQLRAGHKTGQQQQQHTYPGQHHHPGHTHTHSRSHVYQHHQQRPSTSSSRSRSYRMPPPPPPTQAGLLTGGGGSSIRSGMAMHTIGAGSGAGTGAGAGVTKGYSTNVTPPAIAASTTGRGQLGRRNTSTSSSRRRSTRGPVANMGVDREVQGRCCSIM